MWEPIDAGTLAVGGLGNPQAAARAAEFCGTLLVYLLGQLVNLQTQADVQARKPEPKWVVRGGIATPEQLQRGSSEHKAVPGLFGFSVQYQPGKTIVELATAGRFRNKQISVTTAEAIVAAGAAAGYGVSIVKSPGSGYHHTVQVPNPFPDDLATVLSAAFTQIPNPAPFSGP
jgi:hypothetical protein